MADAVPDGVPPSSHFASSRRVSRHVGEEGRASEKRSPHSRQPRCSARPCASCAAFAMVRQRPSTVAAADETMVIRKPHVAAHARWSTHLARRLQLYEPEAPPPRRERGAGRLEKALQSGDGAAVVEAALKQQQRQHIARQERRRRWAPLVTLDEATGALDGDGLEARLLRLEERIAAMRAELAAGLLGPLRRLCAGGAAHAVAPASAPLAPAPPAPTPAPPAPPASAPPQKACPVDETAGAAAAQEPERSAEFAEPAPPLSDAGASDGQAGAGALMRPPPRRPSALPPCCARHETLPSPFEAPLPPIGARPLPPLPVERPRPPPGRPPPRKPAGPVVTSL